MATTDYPKDIVPREAVFDMLRAGASLYLSRGSSMISCDGELTIAVMELVVTFNWGEDKTAVKRLPAATFPQNWMEARALVVDRLRWIAGRRRGR